MLGKIYILIYTFMNFILIKGEPHSTSNYITNEFRITADRLKKWREGRGVAKTITLRYIELYSKVFLYNLNDIEKLMVEHRKIYGDHPTIYKIGE